MPKPKQIFDYKNYRTFLRDRIHEAPKNGYGEMGRLCRHLGVHSSFMSQVFSGLKHLSLEHTCELSRYWGLTDLESEYLDTLVLSARASTIPLKKKLEARLDRLATIGLQATHRVAPSQQLTESDRALFYSSWTYSAVRLATSIPTLQRPESIAQALDLPAPLVRNTLRMLIQAGLCQETDSGFTIKQQTTHLPSDSPWVSQHHTNWRLKAIERAKSSLDPKCELQFTAPVSVSRKDLVRIRTKLLEFIEEISGVVKDSKEETVACLNLDWFEVLRNEN